MLEFQKGRKTPPNVKAKRPRKSVVLTRLKAAQGTFLKYKEGQ